MRAQPCDVASVNPSQPVADTGTSWPAIAPGRHSAARGVLELDRYE